MEKGRVHETIRRLAQRLESEKIEYAIIGGMALALPLVLEEKLDQSVRAEYRRLREIAQ